MKKLFFLVIAVFFVMYLPAQTIVVFHEDFELPSLGDSLQNSSDPVGGTPWAITTHLKNSGLRADSNRVQIGTTVYLTTNSFSTVGYSNISLKFAQICKLYVSDGGVIEVSTDGGTVWSTLTYTHYNGTGVLPQGRFCESSYPDWLPGDTLTKPTSAWWKNEIFNISSIAANQADVKIRFRYLGSGNPAGFGRYGWLLDDVKVFAANNELIVPRITFKTPVLKDTIYITGPLTVNAWVKDSSSLSSVNLIYSTNGGPGIVLPMTNVMDSLYTANIPSLPYNTTVCYSIEAKDLYNNTSTLPVSNCQQFLLLKGNPLIQVGNGTLSGSNAPMYLPSATTTALYSYYATLITKNEILSGGTIESIAFNKMDAAGYTLSNATMRIYIKSTSDISAPANYTDYANGRAGATKVYESTTQNLNTAAGWQTFTCNTGNLLSYAGNENLMVYVEFYHPGNATGAVNWQYETVAGKASTFYGVAAVPTTAVTTGYRANIKINFESSTFVNDARVSAITSPNATVIANSSTLIAVKIKNLGSATLTESKIKWAVDGILIDSAIWNGSLNQDFLSSTINIGNYNFPLGPHIISAWTENPNNVADQNPANDTLNMSIYSCTNISGVFTVGSVTADYATINDVFTALGNCGVNGPVTFKIKSGTYNQQLNIPLINNVSAINTITFESESGIQGDVNFIYSATAAADNFVLNFNAAKYIKVKNITFKATGATYAYVALLSNGASYNTIEGCKLEMNAGITSSSSAGIYNASTFNENYNTFKNNTILNGYYGIYIYGSSTTSPKEIGNVIDGNNISGNSYYSIYSYSQDSIIIKSNTTQNMAGVTYAYGLYSYYNSNVVYTKNKFNCNAISYNYCMYLYYLNNTAGTGLIANNFLSQSVGTSTTYGLYVYTPINVNIYNNSVYLTGVYTSGYAFYIYGGTNNNIVNNIFCNTGGGYAYYGSSTTGINTSNYNDLFTTGTNFAYWGGARTTLAALQTVSSKDANSISINPQFVAWNNLHINNNYLFNLAAKGTSLTDVADDIDGDVRVAIPFIGADEFTFPQNDAGVVVIPQPITMLPTLNQDIKVSIQNLGLTPLTSVSIKCLVNGVALPVATYTNTTGLAQFGVDSLIVATAYTFPAGYSQIKVYTELPNNMADTYNGNDTLYKSVYACTGAISGAFTIGGTGANYPSLDAAMVSLQCGISGPVVFNINPGTYIGNYTFPNVTGSSVSNTITFQSANNDSTSVILKYNAIGTADNFLFVFNNTGNITLKGLTLKALNGTNANIITLSGTLSNINIQNCVLEGTQTTSADDNQLLIRCSTLTQISGFNLISNVFNYGRMAIMFTSTTPSVNVMMKYNYMYNQSTKPMNLGKIDALDFGYNNLFSDATKTGNGGIFLANLTGAFKFYNNTLINLGGIRVWEGWTYGGTTAGQEAMVYNNYLYGSNVSSYVFDGGGAINNIKFYNNTFVGNSTAQTVNFNNFYGANVNITFKNNIMQSTGRLLYFTANPTGLDLDYNDYYSTGATWAYFWGSSATNLATVKSISGQEAHSMSINPQFAGIADPHITNYALKGLAFPLTEVTTDIDGNQRSTTAPDPGCDELQLYADDAGVVSMAQATICPGTTNVIVKLKNYGTNTLNSATINWSINGLAQTAFSFGGVLSSLADSNINLGTYNFLSLTAYNLKFWTSVPNGTNDGYAANDTLKFLNLYSGLAGGTYTVGDATSDFIDLTAAVNFISSNGVCGPVVFNVKPGTYTGRYTIPAILGASAINTITIKSLNNDSTSVILAATASATTNNWIVKLNGCQYVTLKNLKFTPLHATYVNAIVITNSSKNNNIIGNFISCASTGTTTDLSLIRSEDVNSTDNLIIGNHTIGGSIGILIKGVSTTSRLDRVYVAKNFIEGFSQYGIRVEYANSPVIDSNVITSAIALSEKHGISLSYDYDSIVVSRNSIYLSNYTNIRGIDMGNCTSSASTKSLLINNFITLIGATGSTNTYGIRLYPLTSFCRVLNNSIYVEGTNTTDTRGINPAGSSTNVEVINNNVLCNYYPAFYENTVVIYADYNNYYSTLGKYAYNNGTSNLTFTSQAALTAAYQKDTNTLSINPGFFSNTNLHTDIIDLFARGKSLFQVTKDIDNQLRGSIPCIGADEFTVLANDARVRVLYTLGSLPKTAGAPHVVKAIVKNVGSTTMSGVNVTLDISGSNSFSNTKTITSLMVGGQDTISFDPFTPTTFGINNVKVSIPADADTTNNQLSYFQKVTDTVFGYADTAKPATYVGFGTASGKMYAKYFVNGTKILHSISAFINKDNTIGKQLYAVVLNSNGIVIDSSAIRTITAADTNTWVNFNVINPPSTSTGNDYFYAGIAQIANVSGFNPVGSQIENPTRPNAFYTSALNGTGLTQRTDLGRFMIYANFGEPTNKDAAMISVLSPNSGCGLTNAETVSVMIQNKGMDTIYGGQNVLTAKYALKLNGNIINVVTQPITDTILPSAVKNVIFSVPLNLYASIADSTYHLVAWVELATDPFAINDSVNIDILSKYTPPAPIVNAVSVPYGFAATLNAISSDTVFWYNQAVGGNKIAQGSSYTTPLLFANDTVWANAVTEFAALATIGTGTSSSTTAGYTPFYTLYRDSKNQILFLASELSAAGIYPGYITSLALNVASIGSPAMTNFEIALKNTLLTALTTTYETGLSPVYSNAAYTPAGTGWQTLTFSTPFYWDGSSNLIIQTCYGDNASYTSSSSVYYHTTAFNSHHYGYMDAGTGCAMTAPTNNYVGVYRPNIQLNYRKDGCLSPRTQAIITVASPPANDAGVLAFTNPTGPVPSNTLTQVKVLVKNHGTQNLTAVKVNYTLNSVLQPQFVWNDPAAPVLPDSTREFTVGSFTLPGGLDTLIAWTSDPNNSTDGYVLNDTAKLNFSSCMAGTFTIGVGKNYPSFTAALNALNGAGVCSNVVFLVDSGLYEERLFLNPVNGVGPNASITFTSASGDSTDVVLHYSLSSAAAWAMKFIGSSYFTFNKMTLSVSGSNTWGRIMELGPNSHHIEISNCVLVGIQGASSNFSLIYMSGAAIKYNTIKNNVMLNGYQVIYTYGVSGNLNIKNTFSNNIIKDFTSYAIYAYYQDSITIIGNTIQNLATSTSAYGIFSYYCSNNNYLKNKLLLNATSTNYGIYIYYNNNTSYTPVGNGLVANNFISESIGTSTTYGIYVYYSINMNVYNNSVNNTCVYTSGYAFYTAGGSANNIVNNIFSNTGGGYAYYATTPGVNISNYNDLYTTGANFAYWSGAATSLTAFKTLSGKDANSLSVHPNFFSISNLHMVNFMIDKMGTPLAQVTDDIDGELRDATLPDIGADEFVLPNNDAGMIALILPISPATTGAQPVKVSFKDWGVLNLTSATINWSVNGVSQSPYLWTGNIVSGYVDTVQIGSYNFPAGQICFKFWTSLPNNVADQLVMNDTISTCITVCTGPLNGTYTIGGTSANYATFNGAVQAMQMCGIGGAVTFNVNPGYYNEQILFTSLTGATATNNITFQSANGDSTSVILGYNFTQSGSNYVIQFTGSQYITIKGITIRQTNASSGRVVNFTGNPSNITIANCRIEMPANTAGTTAGIVTLSSDYGNDNKILNNYISSGYNGIVLQGSSAVPALRNIVKGNIITGFSNYGIQCTYANSPVIDSNTVSSLITYTGTKNGILLNNVTDSLKLTRNTVILSNSSNTNGILFETVTGTALAKGLVANNFISILNGSNLTYGLRIYPLYYCVVANNSINVNGSNTTDTRGINVVSGSNIEIYNNNVVSKFFPNFYEANLAPISASDFNNFYSLSNTYAYFNGTSIQTYASLAALNAITHLDSNSVSTDPDFISNTNLHVYTSAVNNLGKTLAVVTDDIDGQLRNATTPDIGADEFTPLPFDLAVIAIMEPSNLYAQAGATIPIKVKIKNYGADSVANFNVVCKIGNAAPVNYLYTNYLLSNKMDSVLIASITVPSGAFVIKVYTSLATDGNNNNDTLKMNYFGVPLKNVPYAENFDNTVQEWFSPESVSLWERGIPNASVINAAHSAPNVWTTLLNGNYTNSNTSILYTPIFDNGLFKADTLKFWHWVDAETNIDGGFIEYQSDLTGPWTRLGQIAPDTNATNWYNGTTMNAFTGTGAGWKKSTYKISNLTSLGNKVQFRFVFTSNATNSNYNGWAIDDFELTLAPIAQDGGVISITSPSTTSLVGDNVIVDVTVKNFGTDTLINIPLKYQIGTGPIITDVLLGPLAPGATSGFTFTQPFQVGTQSYTIKAFTEIFGDIYTTNDMFSKSVTVMPALNDVGVTQIIVPDDTVGMGGTTPVKVLIKNFGSQTQTAFTIGYQRGIQPAVEATWTGSLVSGATAEFVFPNPMSIPSGSSFSLAAYTKLPNDAYVKNDTLILSITICNIGKPGAITGLSTVNAGTNNVMYRFSGSVTGALYYNWYYSGNDVHFNYDLNNKDTVYLDYGPAATSGILSVKAWNGNCEGNASELQILIGVGIDDINESNFWLGQNMPNPTTGLTNIEYYLPASGEVKFDIMNLFGQKVYSFSKKSDAGKHLIDLDVKDLSSGVYYYTIQFNDKRLVKKMVVNK